MIQRFENWLSKWKYSVNCNHLLLPHIVLICYQNMHIELAFSTAKYYSFIIHSCAYCPPNFCGKYSLDFLKNICWLYKTGKVNIQILLEPSPILICARFICLILNAGLRNFILEIEIAGCLVQVNKFVLRNTRALSRESLWFMLEGILIHYNRIRKTSPRAFVQEYKL